MYNQKRLLLIERAQNKEPSFFPLSFPPEDGYVRMFLRGRPVTIHIPDQQRESYSLDQKVALPDHKLKLQWVYPSDWGRETKTV